MIGTPLRFVFQEDRLWWWEGEAPELPPPTLRLPEEHAIHRVAPS
jgi:hypothetical protein